MKSEKKIVEVKKLKRILKEKIWQKLEFIKLLKSIWKIVVFQLKI